MFRILPALAAASLVIGYGVAEGVWSGRWRQSTAPQEASTRLATVPLVVGNWHGEPRELDPRVAAHAELNGWIMRRYTHVDTGEALIVYLVCGQAGPVSVHTPDVCFLGEGYLLPEPPTRHAVPAGGVDEFLVGDFRSSSTAAPDPIRVYWAWSVGDVWSAPEHPRIAFARAPALYKLYVVRSMESAEVPAAADQASEFLQLFLPQLRVSLAAEPLGGNDSRPVAIDH